MDESEEEKMRRRRERAAAWAAGKADVAASDNKQLPEPVKGSHDSRAETQIASRDWRGWAHDVSSQGSGVGSGGGGGDGAGAAGGPGGAGGWRNMVGGLQTLADSFGAHNSAARKLVPNICNLFQDKRSPA
jgi:hypothetical protein